VEGRDWGANCHNSSGTGSFVGLEGDVGFEGSEQRPEGYGAGMGGRGFGVHFSTIYWTGPSLLLDGAQLGGLMSAPLPGKGAWQAEVVWMLSTS